MFRTAVASVDLAETSGVDSTREEPPVEGDNVLDVNQTVPDHAMGAARISAPNVTCQGTH